MAWLRITDDYSASPKIAALTDAEYRAWHRILEHCARYRTQGAILPAVLTELPGVTRARLNRYRQLGLNDEQPETEHQRRPDALGYVHDWAEFNGATIEERVLAYLDDHPDATANEIVRAVGGRRKIVLAVLRTLAQPGSRSVPKVVPERFPTGSQSGSQLVPDRFPTGSQSGSCARAAPAYTPDSSEISGEISSSSERASAQEPDDDERNLDDQPYPALLAQLDALHPTPNQRARWHHAAREQPDRVRACLHAALRAQNPAAYLDHLIQRGDWPVPDPTNPPPPTAAEQRRRELARLERRMRELAEDTGDEAFVRREIADQPAWLALTPGEQQHLFDTWQTARAAAPTSTLAEAEAA